MVVQKTIDNLKERPKDEKTAIAGGIAITVVVILLVAWGFWIVKKLSRGEDFNTFISAGQEKFYPTDISNTQKQLQEEWEQTQEQLRAIRDAAAADKVPYTPPPTSGSDNQFGVPNGGSF